MPATATLTYIQSNIKQKNKNLNYKINPRINHMKPLIAFYCLDGKTKCGYNRTQVGTAIAVTTIIKKHFKHIASIVNRHL